MTPEDLRRLNRLSGLPRREQEALLHPRTRDEVERAVAGEITDKFPDAIIETGGTEAALKVTIPSEGVYDHLIGRRDKGQ